jgi:periplasmic protein CpxP/Spy
VKSTFASIAAVGALALSLAVGAAVAQEPAGDQPMHRGMHHGMMGGPGMGEFGMFLHGLNLTDQQKAQVKQIFESERPNMKPLHQQEAQFHQQMVQLVTSGNFDQAKANAIAAQEAQVHTQMTVEHLKIGSQIYALLDSDQKAKVADMIAKHQQHMQEHMQNQSAPADQQQ